MAFQLSPGVLVTEEDRTTVVPSVATTAGAFSGAFQWGPVEQVTTVNSENNLVEQFGRPNDDTAGYFFTAANFLSYGNNLQLIRVINKATAKNAVSTPTGSVTDVTVISSPDTLTSAAGFTVTFDPPSNSQGITATGFTVLSDTGLVNSIGVSDPGFGYSQLPNIVISGGGGTGATAAATLQNGRLTFVVVAAGGNNYSSLSNVEIVGGGGLGAQVEPIITYSLAYANVITGGTDYTNNATIGLVDGDGTIDANLSLIVGYAIDSITVGTGGNGYIDGNVTVTISGGNGTGAVGNIQLDANGVITAISLDDAGSGYTSAPNIIIDRNDDANVGIFANATATAVLSSNGTIKGVLFISNGQGYTIAPNVVVIRNEANVEGANAEITLGLGYGTINAVTVLNSGNSFTSLPTVVFNRNSSLGGTNASAIPRIEYSIQAINVNTRGSGYSSTPNVTIVPSIFDNPGNPASAAAIVTYRIADVVITNTGTGYSAAPNITITNSSTGQTVTANTTVETQGVLITNSERYDDVFSSGGLLYGEFAAKYAGQLGNSLKVSIADADTYVGWEYAAQFDSAPGTSSYATDRGGSNDEIHIIIVDNSSDWTGVPGTILEKYSFVSKGSDARNTDGSSNYYKDVLNTQSRYLWWMNHIAGTTNWGTTVANKTFDSLSAAYSKVLSAGVSGDNITAGNVSSGYSIFSNDELYDISLIPMGPTSDISVVNSVISIAESRRDTMVFVSPPLSSVQNTLSPATNIRNYRDTITSSSFAVLDSGWKYQYDRYNDKYRFVPLNGDIAGLTARTDYIADPWFSPAGYNRGIIKNVVKLAYSPSKTDRDELYKKGINPVVTFPGQGTILFGDKTLQARPSAFDRINVRRLFIILEKAIATASKFQLFEFNDPFTRAQFRNLVEPFLRDVQGRRGITDFRVICDETNNTDEIVDRNEFVADIFIKPARSINFIRLNFVATRSSVSFEEVGA